MTRITCMALTLFTVASLSSRAGEITVTGPKSDYLIQVDRVLMPALLAELDKHPVSATVTFSFILDERGHQSAVEVSSTPHDRSAEGLVARTIRRLKFPPVPPGRANGNKVVRIKNTLTPKTRKT
jgi:hypothetical protein